MDFINKLIAFLPFGKRQETLEYYFALNISSERLTAALWTIEGKKLEILATASDKYSSLEDIIGVTDRLLDNVLGVKELEPQKILFGVPEGWLQDDNLKEDYLKLLRGLVKDLELTPMAYVATSHALLHFLEKTDGVPTTAVLVGFEDHHLEVIVVRAGKLDGAKVTQRGDSSGADIEKALLTFSDVETLPSKILIYGQAASVLEKLKGQLLSFPWMSKLSFLHFPKIDILQDDIEIISACFAGASEIQSNVVYISHPTPQAITKPLSFEAEERLTQVVPEESAQADVGFVVGDVWEARKEAKPVLSEEEMTQGETKEAAVAEAENFEETAQKFRLPFLPHFSLENFLSKNRFANITILAGIIGIVVIFAVAYLFLVQAQVKIFVEPKVLEKDSQVTADPNQKVVNEDAKIIPGQIVETEVSGSQKGEATGKKQIGDPAKGTVVIYNKTDEGKTLTRGTTLTSLSGLKFSVDTSVSIASQSASFEGITFGKANTTVTAAVLGADGNLPSGTDLTVSGFPTSQIIAKAEGNFSGGTSKEVTVVADNDQKKLLAVLASDLRRQAKQKLQEKLQSKKILEEALSEEIIKKSYSKNVNDQANEFLLNLTIKYKGTAFEEKDLKQIVSKLVTTEVPQGFELNLAETETQADVSKLEKDGRLIFLARFKAKLISKLDTAKIKSQIKLKTPQEVANILKGYENILGSEIKLTPSLPKVLERLPALERNIKIEVGLK